MKLRTTNLLMLSACLSILFSGCTPETPEGENQPGDTSSVIPEITIDKSSPRSLMGLKLSDLSGRTFKLGSRKVQPQVSEDGKWLLEPNDDSYSELVAYSDGARLPFGGKADDKNAKVPYSQFYGTTGNVMQNYPLFAKKNKYGNYVLKDGFAMLNLQINGSGNVNSIKVRSQNGRALSADGLDFVVLNCIRKDGGPVALPANFQIPVQAGSYGDLEITICDSRRQMKRVAANIPAFAAGDTESIEIEYVPASNILFYEGFDNCVWGSDPTGFMMGYAPDSEDPGKDGRTTATGYEAAYSEVAQGVAGTGYMTPNTWADANTVAASHTMSESYIKSRAFMDWMYLFRTQEYQGCIGVGVGSSGRGWVETPNLTNLAATSDVEVSFMFACVDGWNEGLEISSKGEGKIVAMSFDGTAFRDASGSEIWATGVETYTMSVTGVNPGWHKVKMTVKGARPATRFQLRGQSTSSSKTHGFFLDDFTVRKAQAPSSEIPGMSTLTTLSTAELSFKFQFEEFASEPLKISLPTGGFLTGLKVDGRVVNHEDTGRESWPLVSEYVFDREQYTSEVHEAVFTLESADKDMTIKLEGDACECTDLSIKKLSSIEKKSFRLLLWNIQYGMWADQGNNYDNFVAWLKKYDADCCVFVEAETVRKSGSSAGESASEKKLNGSSGGTYTYNGKYGWKALASRYNHSYVANSADKDNYSQEITSKTAITKVLEIYETSVSNKPVQHGAGYFTINAGGRKINIVTYHAMPFNYDPTSSNLALSESLREGDAYRKHEVEYILNQTVKNSAYSSERNWIFLGDMNSHSPIDNWYYGYASSNIFAAQDYIRNNTSLKDVIGEKYPNNFMASTMSGKFRIDYVYASDAMMDAVTSAVVIRDKWTSERPSGVEDCTHPSDHRPILVDFQF